MICYVLCLLLGFPLISSFNLTITHLKTDSHGHAEFSTGNIFSAIDTSKEQLQAIETFSTLHLLNPLTKSLQDKRIAERNENNYLVDQNELLSNYYGNRLMK